MYKECVSSKLMFISFKYGVLLFFIILVTILFFLLSKEVFFDPDYIFKVKHIIILITFSMLICCASFIYIKTKILYMSKTGLSYNNIEILWGEIEKIYYPLMSPPFIIIRFKKNLSTTIIISILPIFNRHIIKDKIENFRKENSGK